MSFWYILSIFTAVYSLSCSALLQVTSCLILGDTSSILFMDITLETIFRLKELGKMRQQMETLVLPTKVLGTHKVHTFPNRQLRDCWDHHQLQALQCFHMFILTLSRLLRGLNIQSNEGKTIWSTMIHRPFQAHHPHRWHRRVERDSQANPTFTSDHGWNFTCKYC